MFNKQRSYETLKQLIEPISKCSNFDHNKIINFKTQEVICVCETKQKGGENA